MSTPEENTLAELLKQFRPSLTKKRPQTRELIVQSTPLEQVNLQEGVLFLLRRATIVGPDNTVVYAADVSKATAIVEKLEGLLFALDLAGAYIKETQCSLAQYLQQYLLRRATLLQNHGRMVFDYPEPIASTVSLSFEKVEQINPPAADLLRLCTFLSSDAIPKEIILKGGFHLGPRLRPSQNNPSVLEEFLEMLTAYALLRRDDKNGTLSIHKLVQIVLKDTMSETVQSDWARRAVSATAHALPTIKHTTWPQCDQYLLHVQACVTLIQKYQIIKSEAGTLLHWAGQYLHERAYPEKAIPLLQQALIIREPYLGLQRTATANTLSCLAECFQQLEQYEKAETLFTDALSIYEQQVGPEDHDTAIALSHLAGLYYKQEKYEQAEPLFLRALAISEKTLGSEHAGTATCLTNLAGLYLQQKKYEQAEPLFIRALAIDEKVFGAEHPEIGTDLNNLAMLYEAQKKYEQAESLLIRALAVIEHHLGPKHPFFADSSGNLAFLYHKQRKYEQAESLYIQALAISEQVRGPHHSQTRILSENYVLLLQAMGRETEATQQATRNQSAPQPNTSEIEVSYAKEANSAPSLADDLDPETFLAEWLATPDSAASLNYLQTHPTHSEAVGEQVSKTLMELQAQLIAWLKIPNWDVSQIYLQNHLRLITGPAEWMLETVKSDQSDKRTLSLIKTHQLLIQEVRRKGVKQAYELFFEDSEIYRQLAEWTNIEDQKSAQSYLEEHPSLLTDVTRSFLIKLKATLGSDDARTAIDNLIKLLQTAQERGATAIYRHEESNELNEAGITKLHQYQASGQIEYLNRALELWQEALALVSPDDPDRLSMLSNLGAGLANRYERTGALVDLEAAIGIFQQAVAVLSPEDPNRYLHLNSLATGLVERYHHTGDLADLEIAITIYQQIVAAAPLKTTDRHMLLNNLGGGLLERYSRTNTVMDLNAAITSFQQALATTPAEDPNHFHFLSNLGNGLHSRYRHTGDLADLEAAITVFQQAVAGTLPVASFGPSLLSNLGNGLHSRYKHTGDLADLEAAITVYQQAVAVAPQNSPYRSVFINHLGNGLYSRYKHTGDLADLEATITVYQQAVAGTPPNIPDYFERLGYLGARLFERYKRTKELADLENVIDIGERGWTLLQQSFAAIPVAYQFSEFSYHTNEARLLVLAYLQRAIHVPSKKVTDHRQAFVVAEGSKSRWLTQLVGRGPLPLPSNLSITIAEREQQLLAILTAQDMRELTAYGYSDVNRGETDYLGYLKRRQELLHELEQIWGEISTKGQEGADYVTLRRGDILVWNDLARLAKDLGPTTVLISFLPTPDRSLLFLLRSGWRAPRVFEILMDQARWNDLFQRFDREIHAQTGSLRRGETWTSPLRLLLDQAKNHLKGAERLILAPAGPGHILPWAIIAERAGWVTHTGEPFSLVTLPTLGVLPRLKRRPPILNGPTVIVGNPTGDLPYAEEEAQMVARLFGTSPLLGSSATKSAVLANLREASLIHMATHAFFNRASPLDAGIMLADGVLTAREVLAHRMHADLLVLSACESGQVGKWGGEELAGLSQAFLQAGVRSLLVSLWPVSDPATAALMQAFYAARQKGTDKALALRQAMTSIQQDSRWVHSYYWGAFVLLGDWN